MESYVNGHNKKEISSMYGVNLSTIYSIIKVYNEENRTKVKIKGGIRKRSLSELHIAKLESWIYYLLDLLLIFQNLFLFI